MCVRCKRYDFGACNQPAATLPGLRDKIASPFTVAGLDYAGPLVCIGLTSKKLYILLTCAVVRTVHLEFTDSLSPSDCMPPIRRLAAGSLSSQWKFSVPCSPWWGG